ncbi:FtsQ-type POTRA domain-containing protein [Terrilactibacillus sp. BCM23-1]|uniref:Cell division protein DivIB n=1 Tax=Terrilactibacillus tamarindi TaxID=2599694 RepID=A0A6N8CQT2_9BACI|nr:FtsQ-type POTRA domain-containing protein [Terrilactibacillus tamarindi]MTT32018.1 FtsQ-type POTRA domain-containing protein [Terrilactibacillus tamarindi]
MVEKKVIPLEDRIPKLKQQRKQKANRRIIFYITLFFILILIIVYFQSPLSKLTHVKIDGLHYTSKSQIINTTGLQKKPHFWDVSSNSVKHDIKKLKTVKKVNVHKQFPNSISIHITEYNRIAYFSNQGTYTPILENGTELPKLKQGQLPIHAPILFNFHMNQNGLRVIAKALTKLPSSIVQNISEIYYHDNKVGEGDLTLYMNDGHKVYASLSTFQSNMALYPDIITKIPKGKKGIVHLSVSPYFEPTSDVPKDKSP